MKFANLPSACVYVYVSVCAFFLRSWWPQLIFFLVQLNYFLLDPIFFCLLPKLPELKCFNLFTPLFDHCQKVVAKDVKTKWKYGKRKIGKENRDKKSNTNCRIASLLIVWPIWCKCRHTHMPQNELNFTNDTQNCAMVIVSACFTFVNNFSSCVHLKFYYIKIN